MNFIYVLWQESKIQLFFVNVYVLHYCMYSLFLCQNLLALFVIYYWEWYLFGQECNFVNYVFYTVNRLQTNS